MGDEFERTRSERERARPSDDEERSADAGGSRHPLLLADAVDTRPVLDDAAERPPTPAEGRTRPREPVATPDADREIGGPLHTDLARRFLQITPNEGFDIQSLNELRLEGVARAGAYDLKLLFAVAARAQELMVRVKAEVDDPLSAAPFLTDQVLEWFQTSSTSPDWPARMPRRWSGLFATSRTSGGKLQVWLNARLERVRAEAIRLGGVASRLRHGFGTGKRVEEALARSPLQQIQGEAAQAILDDLAAHPRSGDRPLPLVRLSELAVRRQVQTVNESLARLFTSPDGGPFVVVHPNRYPDCPELVVRPPAWGASGAALAYHLVAVRREERPDRRPRRGRSRSKDEPGEGEPDAVDEPGWDASVPGSLWERTDLDTESWRDAVDDARRTRRRLDAPPKDFRTRESYGALRTALLESAQLRPQFLAVRWRGRPSGLALLVSLLSKGSLSPEVLTDHEYLDAELGDLAKSDPDWKPEDGTWEIPGWKVSREGDHRDGFRYRAEPSRRVKES